MCSNAFLLSFTMARRSLRIQEKKGVSSESQTHDAGVIQDSDSIVDRKRAREDEEDQEYDEDPDDGEEVAPKRKKKKTKKVSSKSDVALHSQDKQSSGSSTKRQRMPEQFRKVRGRLGLLEKLAKEVPLDVILEVIDHRHNLLRHNDESFLRYIFRSSVILNREIFYDLRVHPKTSVIF